jgi:hypothetical protein
VGLAEMIKAFTSGCDAKYKTVARDVEPLIVDRFSAAFEAASGAWPKAKAQVLTIAAVAGRLAALYADLGGSAEVEWDHARFGLRDAQEECQAEVLLLGKHCANVNLGPE